jgi:hypothetical protein
MDVTTGMTALMARLLLPVLSLPGVLMGVTALMSTLSSYRSWVIVQRDDKLLVQDLLYRPLLLGTHRDGVGFDATDFSGEAERPVVDTRLEVLKGRISGIGFGCALAGRRGSSLDCRRRRRAVRSSGQPSGVEVLYRSACLRPVSA